MSDKTLAEVDLVGVTDIARRAGVTTMAVQKWRERYTDFPDPVVVLVREYHDLSLWDWSVVDAWRSARGLGR
jgi:hypothetical protein